MIPLGLLRLAVGRAEGIKAFGNSNEAVAASLAPLIAFPLVMSGLTAISGLPALGAVSFLSRFCAVLALPVLVHEAARRARRETFWRRTVTALNWSFWPMLLVAVGFETGIVFGGLSDTAAAPLLGVLLLYLLWYQWFIIRAGLGFGVLAALALVIVNDVAVVSLSAAPLLLVNFAHGRFA